MTPPPVEEPALPEITRQDVLTSDPERLLSETGQAAKNRPTFGSVFQTSEPVSSLTTSFDGRRFTVNAQRLNKRPIRIDTADAILDADIDPVVAGLGPNRSARSWATLDIVETGGNNISATVGIVAVEWADGNPNDYLAAGFWLHAEGNILSEQITDAGVGAFVDGPEIDSSNPAILPVSGTATYTGGAGGMYGTVYGTEAVREGVGIGSVDFGFFAGSASLTADFTAKTIRGCIGCEGDVLSTGVFVDSATGEVYGYENEPSAVEIRLGATPITSSGAFSGTDVTVRNSLFSIIRQGGNWGGRFSSINDAEGDPRLVAGTFGGEIETAGGTQSAYLGSFDARKQ